MSNWNRSRWSAACLSGLLVACGGGGSNRADPPPTAPPPTPPPPATVVETPNPVYSRHIIWTGADVAHAAGLTGAGIRIGIIDSGVNRNHPALAGRVIANLNYINPGTNNLNVDDVVGHGTAVAQVAAGKPFGQWPGGIAPGAQIVSARIISDKPPVDDGSGQGNEVSGALGLEPIHRDLIGRGVRIMNNSWGGLYWTNPNATAPIAAEYRPFITQHGGLVVFSTGNSGFDNPSDTAALPSQAGTGGSMPAADLERGWLAVAALDGDLSNQLAEYSNACGIAMHYCLAAPGTVVVTGTDNAPNAPDYWQWRGTSFSAPIVSGAAALVWEAFPYFSNDQVRQTLLGTADDIGERGIDPIFGNGALNIARAIDGPGRLDWGDVSVNFNGITSTWNNRLTGDAAVIKQGDGTLVLTNNAHNTGGVQVYGGALQFHHEISGDTIVGPQGHLQFAGPGSWLQGNLDSAGRVELSAAIGGQTRTSARIGGDYLHRAGAVLQLWLGQLLDVTGTATLQGGTLHIAGVQQGYTTEAREWLLAARDGLTGRFETLSWSDSIFLAATLGYDDNSAWLDITRLDVASAAKSMAGITAAGLSSARRMETAFDRIDAQRNHGGDGISDDFIRIAGDFQRIDDEAQARATLDSLSGESHALATALTFDGIDMGRRALSSRFGAMEGRVDRTAVWKQSLGSGGMGGFAGNGFHADGWMIGREQPLGARALAGFSFGELRVDDRVGANAERSRDRQAFGQFHAGRVGDSGYALAQFGFGRFDRMLERSLFAGEDARRGVASRYSGRYTTLSMETGRRHRIGALQLDAYLGGEHTRLQQDSFAEWGGNGFGLHANAATMARTQAIAGVRGTRDWRGATFRAYGEWQETLSADGFDVDASFIGIDSWSPLPTAAAAKSGGVFGIGMDAWLTRNARLSFGMDQRFGPRGDERMASMRYVFGF